MAFSDVATLAADVTFSAKVKAAMVKLAIDTAGDPTITDDGRTAFAAQILRNPDVLAGAVAYDVAAQVNGVAPATDAAYTGAVTTVLLAIARRR